MGYQPLLIAPFQTGLDVDLDPWMSPDDAFKDIINGHIHHGRLEKRKGFQLLGKFTENQQSLSGVTLTGTDPVLIETGSAHGFSTGDVVIFYSVGGTTELNRNEYTITVTSTTEFELDDTDSSNFSAYTSGGFVSQTNDERIMGIYRRIDDSGAKELIVFNKSRASTYDSTNEVFRPLDSSDILTSSDSDFVWADNYNFSGSIQNRLYFTNGLRADTGAGTDGLQYWDGGTTTNRFVPTFNSGANTLEGAKMLFAIKGRLLLLYTLENGNDYPQRARWCQPQADPEAADVWDDATPGRGGFVDAATGDLIVSARRLQNQIIVFMTNSVWTLRPNANPALPFVWDKINDYRSTQGRFATVGYDNHVTSMGVRGITNNSAAESQRVDSKIEDFVTERVNADLFNRIYGSRSFAVNRSWFLYSDQNSETADEVNNALIFDEGTASWSIYNIAMNVLGYGNITSDTLLSDFVEPDMDFSLQDVGENTLRDYFYSGEQDIFLGGNRNGEIHVLEQGESDNGLAINFELMSSSWNFTRDQGTASQLGYIDFYVETEPSTIFEVSFYKNDEEYPYKQQFVDCLPDLHFVADIVNVEIPETVNVVDITQSNPAVVETDPNAEYLNGDQIFLKDIAGMTELNDQYFLVSNISGNTFELQNLNGDDIDSSSFSAYTSGGVVQTLVLIEAPSHGLESGEFIYLYDVEGSEINDTPFTAIFYQADDSLNTFRLSEFDGSSLSPYMTSGKVVRNKLIKRSVWKRAFAGGVGFQHRIRIRNASTTDGLVFHGFRPWYKQIGARQI